MSRLALLFLSFALLAGGCRRRAATTPPETQPDSEAAAAEVAATATSPSAKDRAPAHAPIPGSEKIVDSLPTAPPHSSKTSQVDRPLTEALHYFFEANNRMPKDFSELVRAKFIPAMPTPPAGKRYAIDRPNMQVVLIGP